MAEELQVQEIKGALVSFLGIFTEYADEIFSERPRHERLDELRTQLQLQEPQITHYLLQILGNAIFEVGSASNRQQIALKGLLSTALLGGNNELAFNFVGYNAAVTSSLNKAIGTLEADLWPPKEPKPVLTISDSMLRDRCYDLLSAPGNYDRVIREATTVLEDRIRNKCPYNILSRFIPHVADQTGENLIIKLFNPDNPILSISSERPKRLAFQRILLGVFSYLRNPYHHKLDPRTEWSWAWSTVALIDRLLAEIEGCVVTQ